MCYEFKHQYDECALSGIGLTKDFCYETTVGIVNN